MKQLSVRLKNVTFKNNNFLVLNDISLEIEKNTMTSIVGRSGAGKSTLLKIMAGLFLPTSGTVEINGKDYYKLDDEERIELRKKVSFVFQNSALISNLSIKENLLLPLNFHYKNLSTALQDKKVSEVLEQVGMADSIYNRPAQLSAGEQKLVSIARALITDPEMIFFDEPLGSLDATISKKILKIIKEYATLEKTTVIIVTYSRDVIIELGDKIMLLDKKKVTMNTDKNNIFTLSDDQMPEIIKDIFFGSCVNAGGVI